MDILSGQVQLQGRFDILFQKSILLLPLYFSDIYPCEIHAWYICSITLSIDT
jgi:hypothetical protein